MRTSVIPTLRKRIPFALLLTMILAFGALGAACSDDGSDEVADDLNTDSAASASPTAIAGVPEDVEEVEITVEDGQFSDDQVEFQESSPSVLQITNRDDVRYTLMIGDLVANGWPIAPNQPTSVEFTTPVEDEYEAELVDEESGEVVDTMTVVVESAGATDGQP